MAQDIAVAVIEDHREDRFFFGLALRDAVPGCRIFEFARAEDALNFLKSPERSDIDYIFVDINLRRMDGFEFIERFKALFPELQGKAQIFFMTGSTDPDDERRALNTEGVEGLLEKPITTVALDGLINGR